MCDPSFADFLKTHLVEEMSYKFWPNDVELDGVNIYLHGEPLLNYNYLLDQRPDYDLSAEQVIYLGCLVNRLFQVMVIYGIQIRRQDFRGDAVVLAKNNFRTLQKFVAHLTAHPAVRLNLR